MINKTNKKIILGLGSIVMAAAPVISVISCGKSNEPAGQKPDSGSKDGSKSGSKEGTKKLIKEGPKKQLSGLLDTVDGLLKGKLSKTLDTPEKKDKVLSTIISLFKHGIKSVSKDQLDNLLGLLGTSQQINDMIHSLLVKDGKIDTTLFDKIFKHGIGGVINTDVVNKILKLLPESISKIVTPEIMEKLLNTGWEDKDLFSKDLTALVTPILPTGLKIIVKNFLPVIFKSIYFKFDKILNVGLLHITKDGLKQLFAWDGALYVGGNTVANKLQGIIGDKMPGLTLSFHEYNDTKGALQKDLYIFPIVGYLLGGKPDAPINVYNITNKSLGTVKEDWTLGGRITKIWKMLGDLSKTTTIDDLLDGIVGIINGGTDNITSSQLNQMFNLVSYVLNYKVKLNEKLLPDYIKSISNLFKGKFLDANNTKPIDFSSVTKAKTINDAFEAAKKLITTLGKDSKGVNIVEISDLLAAFNVPLKAWVNNNQNEKDTTAYNLFDIKDKPKPLSADILNAKSKISSKDFNNLKEFLLNGLGSKTLTQEELTKTIDVLVSTVSTMVDLGLPLKGKLLAQTVTELLKGFMTSITDDLKKTPVSAK